ncbi:hypothetical protein [Streptomyces sp. NPDC086182]|uniref:hypothetical protein n=1 Tax=Streptomyces sp. NPDC086182 TaxID=3155058 RepID=UPI003429451C
MKVTSRSSGFWTSTVAYGLPGDAHLTTISAVLRAGFCAESAVEPELDPEDLPPPVVDVELPSWSWLELLHPPTPRSLP